MTTIPNPTGLAVIPFEPKTAPQEQRLAVGQLLTEAFSFAVPKDPPLLPDKEAISITHVGPDEQADHFVVWNGTQAVGWGMLRYDLKQNLHAAQARLVVHPDHRHHGLGQALWRSLEAVARRENRRLVTSNTSSRSPDGETFAHALGAEAALPMRLSRLDLADVDAGLMARWRTRPGGDPYRLHVWQTVPDDYIERAADMMMVMNTAPRGDLEVDDWTITPEMIRAWDHMIEEAGEVRFMMAAENTRNGQLDGYTEVFWTPERAALVFQGATAVRPSARGLGLGKWLKAAMLEQVRVHCPGTRWIHTGNANVNEAMLGINVAMGFRPWGSLTEWQLKLA